MLFDFDHLNASLVQYIESYQSRLERICRYQDSNNVADSHRYVEYEKRELIIFIQILKGLQNVVTRRHLIYSTANDKTYCDGYVEGILRGTTITADLLLEELMLHSEVNEQAEITLFYQLFNRLSAQIWQMIDAPCSNE